MHDLASGRRAPTPSTTRALAKVSGGTLRRARVDAGGTRLRLRALHVMGHGSARIARALSVREATVRAIVTGDASTVSTRLRDDVTSLYDAWWDKRAPERDRHERAAATAARRKAIAGNWCAGAGLDDDELDTPGYKPKSSWKPSTGTGTAPDINLAQRPLQEPRRPPGPQRRTAMSTARDETAVEAPVALKILDDSMSSDRSPHTARLAPGEQHAWEVSWLPGRHLNRNEAVTAMVLADTTANGDVRPGHRAWPHVEGWAAELGMTGTQALDCIVGPPRWARHQEKSAEPVGHAPLVSGPKIVPLDPDPVVTGWIEDPDPIDLGWADDPDWPEPEYPDPSWPGFGGGLRRPPAYLSDLAVSDWHQERHPGSPANHERASHSNRDPQPAPEPDKLLDWEAGQ